jgi:hypothetical protein
MLERNGHSRDSIQHGLSGSGTGRERCYREMVGDMRFNFIGLGKQAGEAKATWEIGLN